MKKFIIVLGVLGVIISGGCSRINSIHNVRSLFPNDEIFNNPDSRWSYLVKTSNSVYYVRSDGVWRDPEDGGVIIIKAFDL